MKLWIYPLMVVFAASCYGTLSTMVKLAIGEGYTASEAVSSQYIVGFMLALLLYMLLHNESSLVCMEDLRLFYWQVCLPVQQGLYMDRHLYTCLPLLAVVMLFQFTWIGTLIDCIIKKTIATRTEIISLIILFIGTILAAGVLDVDLSGIDWRGWVYGFAAAVSFSLNMNVNTKQVEGMNTTTRLLFVSFIAMLL